MKLHKIFCITVLLFCMHQLLNSVAAQQINAINKTLSAKEKSIITISSLTARGHLLKLKTALSNGLEAGLTVNEIKEVLVHLYAYCGFPRSIRGLQTFMEVLNERQAQGIIHTNGAEVLNIKSDSIKYLRGKKILSELTKMPQPDKAVGYAAFAPVIDTFLKEHLFADIFERNILTYAQRELVTISVIAAIGNAAPMLQSHFAISLNVGITAEQLQEFVTIIKSSAGKRAAKAAQKNLKAVLEKAQ
jgi:alkylhydroperoxidase/carboxymuconolactone decarboxylase family protein YurZ